MIIEVENSGGFKNITSEFNIRASTPGQTAIRFSTFIGGAYCKEDVHIPLTYDEVKDEIQKPGITDLTREGVQHIRDARGYKDPMPKFSFSK